MNRNSSNLTSAGSEIISNISSQRSLLFSAGKAPKKIITKSYKITSDTTNPDNNINNNNYSEIKNNSNKKEPEQKNIIHNIKDKSIINISNDQSRESKGTSSLNLSNIKYKDGYILKDAVNSNPGYGLWSVKLPIDEKDKKIQKNYILPEIIKKEETKNYNNNNININDLKNKYHFNDEDLNYKYTNSTFISNEEIENNIKNKKIIDKLSTKLKDLEKKYIKALSNYHEKKFLCQNAIKMKKEYDQLFMDNTSEMQLIKQKTQEINAENKILEDELSNTRNEINRLINVQKEDKNNMDKMKEEYENRLIKEENEREKLKEIIKNNEKMLEDLHEKNNEIDERNKAKEELKNLGYGINFDFEGSEKQKDFQIKQMKDIVLNLQIKISNLKKEISNNSQEIVKLNSVLNYKNLKEEGQKININNLFYMVEENEINAQRNNIILKRNNELIKNLNNNMARENYIFRNLKKLPKSSSQKLLFNKNNYNL